MFFSSPLRSTVFREKRPSLYRNTSWLEELCCYFANIGFHFFYLCSLMVLIFPGVRKQLFDNTLQISEQVIIGQILMTLNITSNGPEAMEEEEKLFSFICFFFISNYYFTFLHQKTEHICLQFFFQKLYFKGCFMGFHP